jgi:5'-deoxynucleotidase YfbR-like HD superfamily hydrolase
LNAQLFNNGTYNFLKKNIVNAQLAYDIIYETKYKIDSLEEIVKEFLDKINKIVPENFNLEELKNEWNKVTKEHDEIIGKDIDEK